MFFVLVCCGCFFLVCSIYGFLVLLMFFYVFVVFAVVFYGFLKFFCVSPSLEKSKNLSTCRLASFGQAPLKGMNTKVKW